MGIEDIKTKEVRVDWFSISIDKKYNDLFGENIFLMDFIKYFFHEKKGVYFNHGEDKLFWIESVEEREDFLFIELHYVKYNKKLDIFDVNNKKTVNIKEKKSR